MLYVSTRNAVDTFTAHRAMYEDLTLDCGFFAPFRLTKYSEEELRAFRCVTSGEAIAKILNMFFGLHLTGWDIECVIGRNPFQFIPMNRRILLAEIWHNPGESWSYLMRSLYGLMIGKKNTQKSPCGWVQIAIEIALLFGIYSSLDSFSENKLDVAVTACDLADTIAVLYAKDLGLPISTVVCTFVENGSVWDFLNKGTFSFSNLPKTGRSMQNNDVTQFLEYLIYRKFGCDEVIRFLSALNRKISYTLREDQLDVLNLELSAAVVGLKRVEAIQSSFLITNQYSIDSDTAVAYGGLQDYRASSGVSKNTLILVKNRMEPIKE